MGLRIKNTALVFLHIEHPMLNVLYHIIPVRRTHDHSVDHKSKFDRKNIPYNFLFSVCKQGTHRLLETRNVRRPHVEIV